MYLLGCLGGFARQSPLWILRNTGRLTILDLTETEVDRMHALMIKYQDLPMDLADASLVAVADVRGYKEIFTFDSDFRIYRLADGSALEVVPA